MEYIYESELDLQRPARETVWETLASVGDGNGHLLRVRVRSGGEEVDLEGMEVYLYALRGDRMCVVSRGEVNCGAVQARVPPQALEAEGAAVLSLVVADPAGERALTVARVRLLTVGPGREVVSVADAVPGLTQVLMQLEEMRKTRERAEAVTGELSALGELVQEEEERRQAAEAQRQDAEQVREEQHLAAKTREAARESAESLRESAEGARQAAENERTEAEAARASQAVALIRAEEQRQAGETAREGSEIARRAAEEAREAAEGARQAAELSRETGEGARQAAETVRQAGEAERGSAEALREAAEGERQAAETLREASEGERQAAETLRQASETARAFGESGRQAAEDARQTSEDARGAAEGARQTSEDARQAAEAARQAAEEERKTAETARAEGETARAGAEAMRREAEEERSVGEVLRGNRETAREVAETLRAVAEQEREERSEQVRLAEAARELSEQLRESGEQLRAQAEHLRELAEQERALAESRRSLALAVLEDAEEEAASVIAGAQEALERASVWADARASAQSLPAGTAPTVEVGEEEGQRVLRFGIPAGAEGAPGPLPQLTMGEVTTGPAGSEASARLTGTPAAPVLELTLPRGDTGDTGSLSVNGRRPDASGSIRLGAADLADFGEEVMRLLEGQAMSDETVEELLSELDE